MLIAHVHCTTQTDMKVNTEHTLSGFPSTYHQGSVQYMSLLSEHIGKVLVFA